MQKYRIISKMQILKRNIGFSLFLLFPDGFVDNFRSGMHSDEDDQAVQIIKHKECNEPVSDFIDKVWFYANMFE